MMPYEHVQKLEIKPRNERADQLILHKQWLICWATLEIKSAVSATRVTRGHFSVTR